MNADETTNHLFVVYLGGDPAPGRLSEDHEVVVVVAPDVKQARVAARLKWKGTSRPHVDAVQTLDVIDGFLVKLQPTERSDSSEIDVTYEPTEGWADG